MIDSVYATSLKGVQNASERVAKAAEEIASGGVGGEKFIEAAVDLGLAKVDYKANLAVIKTTREMEDAALSILA